MKGGERDESEWTLLGVDRKLTLRRARDHVLELHAEVREQIEVKRHLRIREHDTSVVRDTHDGRDDLTIKIIELHTLRDARHDLERSVLELHDCGDETQVLILNGQDDRAPDSANDCDVLDSVVERIVRPLDRVHLAGQVGLDRLGRNAVDRLLVVADREQGVVRGHVTRLHCLVSVRIGDHLEGALQLRDLSDDRALAIVTDEQKRVRMLVIVLQHAVGEKGAVEVLGNVLAVRIALELSPEDADLDVVLEAGNEMGVIEPILLERLDEARLDRSDIDVLVIDDVDRVRLELELILHDVTVLADRDQIPRIPRVDRGEIHHLIERSLDRDDPPAFELDGGADLDA